MITQRFRIAFAVALCMLLCAASCKSKPGTTYPGRFEEVRDFPSQYVQPHRVTVWLPTHYTSARRYAVWYMQDGQMIFEPDSTWNGQSWQVHRTIDSLSLAGVIEPVIVVGIWNGGLARHSEYFPQRPFERLDSTDKKRIYTATRPNGNSVFNERIVQSDAYLKFVVNELKPYVDQRYATLADVEHTYIAGSSMGGLISIYALCEYPHVFGRAACLSTHWPGIFTHEGNSFPSAMVQYLSERLPPSEQHRLYFDYGTVGLDTLYKEVQLRVDSLLTVRGYHAINWKTQEIAGGAHTEYDWRIRFHVPLSFLSQP